MSHCQGLSKEQRATGLSCSFLRSGSGSGEIFVWGGNECALAVNERLGLEPGGGMVRAGPVHDNSLKEIERFGEVLGRIGTIES